MQKYCSWCKDSGDETPIGGAGQSPAHAHYISEGKSEWLCGVHMNRAKPKVQKFKSPYRRGEMDDLYS